MLTYTDTLALRGRVLVPGAIIDDGALLIREGTVVYAGPRAGAPAADYKAVEGILAPGFVDIHCHAAGQVFAHEDPKAVADHHLRHGTTGMLLTFYRDLPQQRLLAALEAVKAVMGPGSNILGAHQEGPYLNPRYGTGHGGTVQVEPENYWALAETGVIRQWTCAPEVEGTGEFIRYIDQKGIVPAIGHSEASPRQVFDAVEAGARIVTHLFDATGCSYAQTRWAGTLETDFSTAALICPELYHEIICDRAGNHVRPERVKLAIRAAGLSRIIGITDCFAGPEDGSDVNFDGADLSGSKLTMDQVAQNFLALGLTVPQVFAVVAENPARALGLEGLVGSLRPGCRGDVLLVDDKLRLQQVWKAQRR